MKHIQIVVSNTIDRSNESGCGECQASCQSACKTSCTVANQNCERKITRNPVIKIDCSK